MKICESKKEEVRRCRRIVGRGGGGGGEEEEEDGSSSRADWHQHLPSTAVPCGCWVRRHTGCEWRWVASEECTASLIKGVLVLLVLDKTGLGG